MRIADIDAFRSAFASCAQAQVLDDHADALVVGDGEGNIVTLHFDEDGDLARITAAPDIERRHESVMRELRLSPRQKEVAQLLLRGSSDAQIAEKLHITITTATFHVKSVLRITGCRRRQEVFAIFYGQQSVVREPA